jgi:hypothetical protein
MQSENLIKCSHAPCQCLVETEDQLCSTACAAAKDEPSTRCPCGHSECIGHQRAIAESNQKVRARDSQNFPSNARAVQGNFAFRSEKRTS